MASGAGVTIGFEAKVGDAEQQIARIIKDLDKFKREAEKTSASVKASYSGLGKIFATLGAGASAAGFANLIKSNIDLADNLRDLSKSTSIAVEDLAGLNLAAKQSGTDLNSVAAAVNKLSVNIGKDGDKFRELGITAKEPLEALAQLADIFVAIEDPQQRAAVAAAALGKSWAETAPLLSEGGAAIRGMIADGKRLTPITQEMADAADQFNDEWEKSKTALAGFGVALTGPVLTALNKFIATMQNATKEGVSFNSFFQGLIDAGRGADNSALGKVNEQIAFLENKIKVMKGQGFIGSLIDDATGQDINLAKNQLEALYKTKAKLEEQQKQMAETAKKIQPPSQDTIKGFVGDGEGKGKSEKGAVVFNNEQLAKSEAIIKRLTAELGLTREQAAGVVGNLFHESAGLKTNARSGDGFGSVGLAQWTFERKKQLEAFAKSVGKVSTDFDTQVQFLIKELTTTENKTLQRLRNTSGIKDATVVFQDTFERPNKALAHTDRRIGAAETAFLGGLTDSERKNQLSAEADQLKKNTEEIKAYHEALASLNDPNIGLSGAQLEVAKLVAPIYERLKLNTDNLTEAQKKQKETILEAAKAMVFETEKMKLQEEQAKKQLEAFEALQTVQKDIADITSDFVNADDLNRGLAEIQDALGQGLITPEAAKKMQDQLGTEFNKFVDVAKDSTDKMTEFSIRAAQNMQDAFANFLFDPFKGSLGDMVDNFANTMRQLAAQTLSEEIFNFFKKKSAGGAGTGSAIDGFVSMFADLFGSVAAFETGTPRVPRTGLAIIHKDEAVVPAIYNKRGESPWHGGGGSVNVTQQISVGNNADKDMVRRAAGQGAREALAVMGSANRYR